MAVCHPAERERRAKLELFEMIRVATRRERRFANWPKKYKVHRRMVRQTLENAIPPERKKAEREQPKLGRVKEFIDVKLSAAGKLFLEDARRILQEVKEAASRAARVARGRSGTLRVGFTADSKKRSTPPRPTRNFRLE
jgi:hypothetical protein